MTSKGSCPDGHLTDPGDAFCRTCGRPVEVSLPEPVARRVRRKPLDWLLDGVVSAVPDNMKPRPGHDWSYDWCFAGETEFLTFDGPRRFKEVAGTTQRVLDGNGDWIEAEVRSFGTQALRKITLKKHHEQKTIHATGEHRWFVREDTRIIEKATDRLDVDDLLASLPNNSPWQVVSVGQTDRVEEVYCAVVPTTESFVLQDGILTGNCRFRSNSRCMFPKELNAEATKQAGYAVWIPEDRGYCPRVKWDDQKKCFSGDTEFLTAEGYRTFKEVDGSPQTVLDGNGKWVKAEVRSFGVQTLRKLTLRHDRRRKAIHVTGSHRWFTVSGERRFEKTTDDLDAGDLLASVPKNPSWTVESVDQTDRYEEVFCAIVTTTQSFVLQDGILTGNCPVGEPGPKSGDPKAMLDATVAWEDGGQRAT
jgi:DNA primase